MTTLPARLLLVLPIAVLAILLARWATQQAAQSALRGRLGGGWADLGGPALSAQGPPNGIALQPRHPRLFDGAELAGLAVAMAGPFHGARDPRLGARRLAVTHGRLGGRRARQTAKTVDPGPGVGPVQGPLSDLRRPGRHHRGARAGVKAGHVVPTLVAWPESAFVYDHKGELWHITADHRKTFSHLLLRPTDPNTVRWNPLFEVRGR